MFQHYIINIFIYFSINYNDDLHKIYYFKFQKSFLPILAFIISNGIIQLKNL